MWTICTLIVFLLLPFIHLKRWKKFASHSRYKMLIIHFWNCFLFCSAFFFVQKDALLCTNLEYGSTIIQLFLLSFRPTSGYNNSHANYNMIAQTEFGSGGNGNVSGNGSGSSSGNANYNSNYGSIASYQSSGNMNNTTLGGSINTVTSNTNSSIVTGNLNPYAGSVIGSSNGYSNMLSLSSGITSVTSCYPISSTHHLQGPDKVYTKDR